jgi:hypothetical protein
MYQHTFTYADAADFVRQMDEMISKLADFKTIDAVRACYPHLTQAAFYNRLKRYPGQVTAERGPAGRIVRLKVTPGLHRVLAHPAAKGTTKLLSAAAEQNDQQNNQDNERAVRAVAPAVRIRPSRQQPD